MSTPHNAFEAPVRRMSAHGRVAWVDWLRVLALSGVFFIHVGEVFNPWDEWHITNAERSKVVGESIAFLAPWIMPLFILLAGTGAWYSLQRRTPGMFARERVGRILVPLVLGIIVFVPPQVYVERRWRGQFDGSFFAFLPQAFSGGIYPKGNISWHHLWFLGHLFVYSLAALPLFLFWRTPRGRAQLARISRFTSGRIGLLWLAIPLLLERDIAFLALGPLGLLLADWSGQSILFVAYIYGFALVAEPGFARNIDAQWPYALVGALASTASLVFITWTGLVPDTLPPRTLPGSLVFWNLLTIGAWAWVVAVLGLGRRLLNHESRILQFGREHGYAWYVIHQPAIVFLAAWIVGWQTGIAQKYAALFAFAFVATVLGTAVVGSATKWLRIPSGPVRTLAERDRPGARNSRGTSARQA
jgi:glucan biosynthesis protein C